MSEVKQSSWPLTSPRERQQENSPSRRACPAITPVIPAPHLTSCLLLWLQKVHACTETTPTTMRISCMRWGGAWVATVHACCGSATWSATLPLQDGTAAAVPSTRQHSKIARCFQVCMYEARSTPAHRPPAQQTWALRRSVGAHMPDRRHRPHAASACRLLLGPLLYRCHARRRPLPLPTTWSPLSLRIAALSPVTSTRQTSSTTSSRLHPRSRWRVTVTYAHTTSSSAEAAWCSCGLGRLSIHMAGCSASGTPTSPPSPYTR